MKRRTFIRALATAGGLAFCGCDLLASTARRPTMVGRKRVRTIDMHCHSIIGEVFPLVEGRKEAQSLIDRSLLDTPMALDAKGINARLREMDRQGC